MFARILSVIVITAALAGCGANHNSIYRHQEVSDGSSVTTVDAKQRAILSNSIDKPATGSGNDAEAVRRFCSEPSPDVYSVFAQALSAGGTLSKSTDPKALEAALNVAFSSSEQGSSIARTQTISMLRELMFRTCERYLNGAYTDLEMSIQAIRDQRLMVSILAIEQITGAVAPRPVLIGASGSAASGPGDTAIVRLDDAQKAKKTAEEAHSKALKAFNELNGDSKECDAIEDALESDTELSQEQKDKKPKCEEAKTSLASAKAILSEKTDHYADLKRLASTSGISAQTVLSSNAQGGIDRAHGEAIEKVTEAVESIVQKNFNNDTETLLFCMKTLTDFDMSNSIDQTALTSLRDTCFGYLKGKVEYEKSNLLEAIQESEMRMLKKDNDSFDLIWPGLKRKFDDGKKDEVIDTIKQELLPPMHNKAECFRSDKSKEEYFECYEALPARIKRKLRIEG